MSPVVLKPLTNDDLNLRYRFTDNHGTPYTNTSYIAYLPDGTNKTGTTDKDGYTDIFYSQETEQITIHLMEKQTTGTAEQLTANTAITAITAITANNARYRFTDEQQQPYKNVEYIAYYPDGREATGITDEDGYTEIFDTSYEKQIKVHLKLTGKTNKEAI